jgi:hypothetical protein
MPYCPTKKGQNETPLGVARGTSAKLPHHKGPTPTYLMENEMSFVHHAVEW